MKAVLLFGLLCLFVSHVVSQVEDVNTFSLFMRGPCHTSSEGTGYCRLKGNSQTIETLISATDAISFTVTPRLGSYALLFISGKVTEAGYLEASGNITFGIHNARDHALFFKLNGTTDDDGSNWGWASLAGSITGGLGVFDSYVGVMTSGGAINGTEAYALVSGHVWNPKNN
jgi:hypothetical protein